MAFRKMEDIKIDLSSIVIYGKNGSGKTRLASTIELTRPNAKILYINVNEDGMISVPKELRKNFEVFDIRSVADFAELFGYLREGNIRDVVGCDIEWIIFDTITQLSEIFVMEGNGVRRSNYTTKDGALDTRKIYADLVYKMKALMSEVKKNNLKSVYLLQEKAVEENGVQNGVKIYTSTGTRNLFLSDSDVVLRTRIINVEQGDKVFPKHCADLEVSENTDNKVRTDNENWQATDKLIIDPTMSKVRQTILGEE